MFLIFWKLENSTWLKIYSYYTACPSCVEEENFGCYTKTLWMLYIFQISINSKWLDTIFQDINITLQQWYNQITLFLFIIFLYLSDISLRALCNTLFWKVKLCQFLICENYGNIPQSSMIGCQYIWLKINEGS